MKKESPKRSVFSSLGARFESLGFRESIEIQDSRNGMTEVLRFEVPHEVIEKLRPVTPTIKDFQSCNVIYITSEDLDSGVIDLPPDVLNLGGLYIAPLKSTGQSRHDILSKSASLRGLLSSTHNEIDADQICYSRKTQEIFVLPSIVTE